MQMLKKVSKECDEENEECNRRLLSGSANCNSPDWIVNQHINNYISMD